MNTAIYPGSFDPVTLGHYDIIERSSRIFDRVIVGVLCNSAKTPLFTTDERVEMLRYVTAELPNVTVLSFDGLLVDFARQQSADVIVRGLRAVTDFEYELQMAQTNRILAPDIDTMFLITSLEYAYLSSTTVKEVAAFGKSVDKFVPPFVAEKMREKLRCE